MNTMSWGMFCIALNVVIITVCCWRVRKYKQAGTSGEGESDV